VNSQSSPKSLFKYQPFNAQSLTNLTKRIVYFCAPSKFNDPFDCNVSFVHNSAKRNELAAVKERLKDLAREQGKFGACDAIDAMNEDAVFEVVDRNAREALVGPQESLRRERGVACFGSAPDNLLMWGHYADGHRGFCLELDATQPPWSEAHRVEYSATPPRIDPVDVLLRPDPSVLFSAMVLTKAKCWEYEQEWRVLHAEAGTEFGYGWDRLKGLYLGAEIPTYHREILCLILREFPTQIFQMQRDMSGFRVIANPVTFTPFLPPPPSTEQTPKQLS
jgi:hypothetical protein